MLRREPRFAAPANVQGMARRLPGEARQVLRVRPRKDSGCASWRISLPSDRGMETTTMRTITAPPERSPAPRMIYPKVESPRPFHVRSADRSLYISLITEGTYPFHEGGVSVWCDQIVRGLAPDRFRVDAITGGLDENVCWEFPTNVVDVRRIPLWGSTGGRRPARSFDHSIRDSAGAVPVRPSPRTMLAGRSCRASRPLPNTPATESCRRHWAATTPSR